VNEQERAEAVNRAAEVKRILEHPLFTAAVTDVRAAVLSAWSASALGAAADREKLWMMDQMLVRVLRALRTHVETGKVAQAELLRDKPRIMKVFG